MEPKVLKALHWIVEILNRHNITYSISGGFAAHLYGSTRPINDIDIDISEKDFEKVYSEVKDFLFLGPTHYTNAKWDLEVMKLRYYDQEIDIGGAFEAKIFDDILQEWIHSPADFLKSKKFDVDGITLDVIDPNDLIEYKKLLSGEHQKVDIEAVQNFIKNSK